MHPEIKTLLYQAEDHYLDPEEIAAVKHHASSLKERLEIYEVLRENEVAIFQPIAEQLLKAFPQQEQEIERVLKYWLSVLRYCAMAMLLNNPEYLQRGLLEWLTEMVKVHQKRAIEVALYQSLQKHLTELLGKQYSILQPLLERAATTLLETNNLAQLQR